MKSTPIQPAISKHSMGAPQFATTHTAEGRIIIAVYHNSAALFFNATSSDSMSAINRMIIFSNNILR